MTATLTTAELEWFERVRRARVSNRLPPPMEAEFERILAAIRAQGPAFVRFVGAEPAPAVCPSGYCSRRCRCTL